MSRDIRYNITADNKEFKEGVEQVKTITEGIEDPFKALGEVLADTNSKFLGMVSGFSSGVLALTGFSLGLEAVVEHMKELGERVQTFKNLSIETGASQEFVSNLDVAARLASISTDKFQQAFVHLSNAMVQARDIGGPMLELFERLGVTEEDLAKGDIEEILNKIAKAYASSADDAFKLEVNTKLFGGKLAELLPLLNDLARYMKEAEESSLRMTKQQQDQISENKENWESLGRVVSGVWKDAEVALAGYMNDLFKAAKSLPKDFSDLWNLDRAKYGKGSGVMDYYGEHDTSLTGPGDKTSKPSLGEGMPQFEQLKKQLRRQEEEEGVSFDARLGFERRYWQAKLAEAQAGGDKYKETAAQIREALLQLDEKSAKDKTRFNEWDNAIQEQQTAFEIEQAQQGTFQKFSVQATADYWKEILDRDDLSTAERLEVGRKWLAAMNQLRSEASAAEMSRFQASEQAARNDLDLKLQLASQELERAIRNYGQESAEARKVADEIIKIAAAKSEQLKKIEQDRIQSEEKDGLAQIEFEKRLADIDEQQGLIDKAQLLRQDQDFENRAFEIKRQGLQQQLALANGENGGNKDLEKAAQLNLQIEELERQHQRNLGVIDQEAAAERWAPFRNMISNMESSWSRGLVQMMNGQLRFSQAMKNLWNNMVTSFEQLVADLVVQWAAKELMQTTATAVSVSERVAIEEAGKEQSLAISIAMGIKEVAISAYKAIAAAWSSISAIPYVGPFLAPAVALATGAAIFAIGSKIASAEGGYDIPAGVNPLTQLHAREMVLPAPVADTVRNAMAGGGAGAAEQHFHYHDHAGQSPQGIAQNQDAAVAMMKRAARSFAR